MKCQNGSLLMESFAGGRQIQTPEQAVTALLVSSSYCSMDGSDPITSETTRGSKEGKKTTVFDEKIFHFLLSTNLFFISVPHSICFAKHFQCSSTVKSPEFF